MKVYENNGNNVVDNKKEDNEFMITDILLTENESPRITLRFKNYYIGGYSNATLKVDEITPASLKKCILRNNGLCVEEDKLYKKLMKEYCKVVKDKLIQAIQKHNKIGWYWKNKLPIFLGDKVVASEEIQSEYEGMLDVKPKGAIKNIKDMIKKHILNCKEWSPLQAVIAFSVGATILPFARMMWGMELNNVVIHLLGGSTTGKSTSLKLHAGLGANVSERNKGFWITHESSLVSIIRRIGNNTGYPVSIDELSTASRREYDEFVYALGNGEEKDRVKPGGIGLQESASFSTVILSSGELSILRKCSANEGIRARCIEIPNVQWTESKEQVNISHQRHHRHAFKLRLCRQ